MYAQWRRVGVPQKSSPGPSDWIKHHKRRQVEPLGQHTFSATRFKNANDFERISAGIMAYDNRQCLCGQEINDPQYQVYSIVFHSVMACGVGWMLARKAS